MVDISQLRELMKQRYENGHHSSWLRDQRNPLQPWLLTSVTTGPGSPEVNYNTAFPSLVADNIGAVSRILNNLGIGKNELNESDDDDYKKIKFE